MIVIPATRRAGTVPLAPAPQVRREHVGGGVQIDRVVIVLDEAAVVADSLIVTDDKVIR